ncbi:MAG: spore germination protein [Clostridiales bacterium]|nr:spore germination protein [Clostridiales bacterium]
MTQLKSDLRESLSQIKEAVGNNGDVIIRNFSVKRKSGGRQEMALVFIDGLCDKEVLNHHVLKPLMDAQFTLHLRGESALQYIYEEIISVSDAKTGEKLEDLAGQVLSGVSALLLDGCRKYILFDVRQWQTRGIKEPETDVVVRGPREGFVETMKINMGMLRRKIKHSGLTFDPMQVGRYSVTDVCVVYLEGVARQEIVDEVKRRLSRIDIDGALESGYLEAFIEEAPLSVFPTVGHSEKPDVVAAKLLEGKVAVMIDGSPFVLTAPNFFAENFASAEDYYTRFHYHSLLRLIRWAAFLVSVLLPGFYVAVTTYHQEFIPPALLLVMAAAEENTPFSGGFSVLLMSLVYEILREAGVRLPRQIGQSVSIVGALIMGDAAVSANIISPAVLIIIGVTVVATFVTSPLNELSTLLRLVFLFAGWFMGGFGLLLAGMAVMLYLCSLRSFSVPYLAPLAPLRPGYLGDVFIRLPLWLLQKRPPYITKNARRMPPGLRPRPGERGEAGE